MTIREIIDLARITTLGSYGLKDDDDAVVQLLNFSLSQVYNRVPVLTQIQHIHFLNSKTRYEYLDDAYKVISATTECEQILTINNDTDPLAIFDMGNHVLDVPMCVQDTTNALVLLLQMRPPKIVCKEIDEIEFTPDDALVPSILSYMAYMVSKSISEENGVGHYNEFMQGIDEVKRLGMYTPYHHTRNFTFHSNGWV